MIYTIYIVGFFGVMLSFLQNGSQILKILQTKQTNDLSFYSYVFLLMNQILWTSFYSLSYVKNDYALTGIIPIISNLNVLFSVIIIIMLKRKYDKKIIPLG